MVNYFSIRLDKDGELVHVPYIGYAKELIDGYVKIGYTAEWVVNNFEKGLLFYKGCPPQGSVKWEGEVKVIKSDKNIYSYFDGFGDFFSGKEVAVRFDEKELEEKKVNEMISLHIYIME